MAELPRPLRALLRDPATPARVASVWQRIEAQQSSPRRWLRPLVAGLAVAACAALLVLRPEPTAAPQRAAHDPSNLQPVATERVEPTAEAAPSALTLADGRSIPSVTVTVREGARTLALSDGTRIELAAGAELVPVSSNASELALRLMRGDASFEVAPQGRRAFRVLAREVEVRVVGTGFSVSMAQAQITVQVRHGKVRVLAARLPQGEILLGDGQTAHVLAPGPPPSAADQVRNHDAAKQSARAAAHDAAAQGDFAHAYALLGEHGFDEAVTEAKSVDQLLLWADTARLSGHPAQAAAALERIADHHSKDSRASIAALSLARLRLDQLHQAAAAARAFERAIALGLPAGLAEDAYARRVEALAQAGEHAQALRAAQAYDQRFPQGRRHAAVRQWVTTP